MDISEMSSFPSEVEYYVSCLRHTGQQRHVTWLQDMLLEVCFIRMGGFSIRQQQTEEPVALLHVCKSLCPSMTVETSLQSVAVICHCTSTSSFSDTRVGSACVVHRRPTAMHQQQQVLQGVARTTR